MAYTTDEVVTLTGVCPELLAARIRAGDIRTMLGFSQTGGAERGTLIPEAEVARLNRERNSLGYTVPQTARYLGKDRSNLHKEIRAGRLAAWATCAPGPNGRIQAHYRVLPSHLTAYLAKHPGLSGQLDEAALPKLTSMTLPHDVMTIGEAMETLGASRDAVHALIHRRTLDRAAPVAGMPHDTVLVTRASVQTYKERRPTTLKRRGGGYHPASGGVENDRRYRVSRERQAASA